MRYRLNLFMRLFSVIRDVRTPPAKYHALSAKRIIPITTDVSTTLLPTKGTAFLRATIWNANVVNPSKNATRSRRTSFLNIYYISNNKYVHINTMVPSFSKVQKWRPQSLSIYSIWWVSSRQYTISYSDGNTKYNRQRRTDNYQEVYYHIQGNFPV